MTLQNMTAKQFNNFRVAWNNCENLQTKLTVVLELAGSSKLGASWLSRKQSWA